MPISENTVKEMPWVRIFTVLTSAKDYWDQFLIVKILQDMKKEMEQKISNSILKKHVRARAKLLQLYLTLCDPTDCEPTRFLYPWDSPDKNTGVGCQALLQGIFPTQGSNPQFLCLLRWHLVLLPRAPSGKPFKNTYLLLKSTYALR